MNRKVRLVLIAFAVATCFVIAIPPLRYAVLDFLPSRPPRNPDVLEIPLISESQERFDYQGSVWQVAGEEHALAKFRGKTIFLYYWTTWSNASKHELPFIASLHQELKHHGIIVIAVSDQRESVLLDFWLIRRKLPPLFYAKELPPALQGHLPPYALVISPDGYVVFRRTTRAEWKDERFIEFLIQIQRQRGPSTDPAWLFGKSEPNMRE